MKFFYDSFKGKNVDSTDLKILAMMACAGFSIAAVYDSVQKGKELDLCESNYHNASIHGNHSRQLFFSGGMQYFNAQEPNPCPESCSAECDASELSFSLAILALSVSSLLCLANANAKAAASKAVGYVKNVLVEMKSVKPEEKSLVDDKITNSYGTQVDEEESVSPVSFAV